MHDAVHIPQATDRRRCNLSKGLFSPPSQLRASRDDRGGMKEVHGKERKGVIGFQVFRLIYRILLKCY